MFFTTLNYFIFHVKNVTNDMRYWKKIISPKILWWKKPQLTNGNNWLTIKFGRYTIFFLHLWVQKILSIAQLCLWYIHFKVSVVNFSLPIFRCLHSKNTCILELHIVWSKSVCMQNYSVLFQLHIFFIHQGFRQNCENVLFISNKKTQKEYKEAFEDMWLKIGSKLDRGSLPHISMYSPKHINHNREKPYF